MSNRTGKTRTAYTTRDLILDPGYFPVIRDGRKRIISVCSFDPKITLELHGTLITERPEQDMVGMRLDSDSLRAWNDVNRRIIQTKRQLFGRQLQCTDLLQPMKGGTLIVPRFYPYKWESCPMCPADSKQVFTLEIHGFVHILETNQLSVMWDLFYSCPCSPRIDHISASRVTHVHMSEVMAHQEDAEVVREAEAQ
jgi:hypothetical protein